MPGENRDGEAGRAGSGASARDPLALRLENAIGSVEIGRLALDAYLEPFSLGARPLNRLEVVFEELISNIVRHNRGASAIEVRMSYDAGPDGGEIVLTVEDDGTAFDPLGVADPEPFHQLEDAKLGGLGIPLIKRLTQSVSYLRLGTGADARNRVVAVIAA